VTLPGFEKVFFSTSKNVTIFLELGTDFVTSSHHFSGFVLEQNTVSKPGQVLGSGFQVFQFRLGTTLTFLSFFPFFFVSHENMTLRRAETDHGVIPSHAAATRGGGSSCFSCGVAFSLAGLCGTLPDRRSRILEHELRYWLRHVW